MASSPSIEGWTPRKRKKWSEGSTNIYPPALSFPQKGWPLPPVFMLRKARAGKQAVGSSSPTSPSGKALFPFWKEGLEDIYEECLLPIDPGSKGSSSRAERSDSWFSMRRTTLTSGDTTTPWRCHLNLPLDKITSFETLAPPNKRAYDRKLKGESKREKRVETRVRKLRLRLTKEQKKVMYKTDT